MTRHLTQQKLADSLGLALRSYQCYEQGTREPSLSMLVAIADTLDVTTDYLLGRDMSLIRSFEESKMFGKRLREQRMKHKLTQQAMADSLSLSLNAYQKYEQGERYPSFDCLIHMADLLNVSVDYLLGRDEYLQSLGVPVDVFR